MCSLPISCTLFWEWHAAWLTKSPEFQSLWVYYWILNRDQAGLRCFSRNDCNERGPSFGICYFGPGRRRRLLSTCSPRAQLCSCRSLGGVQGLPSGERVDDAVESFTRAGGMWDSSKWLADPGGGVDQWQWTQSRSEADCKPCAVCSVWSVYAFTPCSFLVPWSPNLTQVLLFHSKAFSLALTFIFVGIAGICHSGLEYGICENCYSQKKKKKNFKMIVLARGLFLTLWFTEIWGRWRWKRQGKPWPKTQCRVNDVGFTPLEKNCLCSGSKWRKQAGLDFSSDFFFLDLIPSSRSQQLWLQCGKLGWPEEGWAMSYW